MSLSRLLAIGAIALAAACGSSTGTNPPPPPPPPPAPPPPPPGGHSTTIDVTNNQFSPTPDTIPAGTITFAFGSANGTVVHNVTWLTGPGALPAGSGDKSAGQSFQTTLATGDYTYHCTHHAGMNGAIRVN